MQAGFGGLEFNLSGFGWRVFGFKRLVTVSLLPGTSTFVRTRITVARVLLIRLPGARKVIGGQFRI